MRELGKIVLSSPDVLGIDNAQFYHPALVMDKGKKGDKGQTHIKSSHYLSPYHGFVCFILAFSISSHSP